MTDEQKRVLGNMLLLPASRSVLHHGDCVGADAEFHEMARSTPWPLRIVGYPPLDESKRAFCEFDYMMEPRPYLDRNHDIVDKCDVLIAAPQTSEERLRSGTWATIRYAEKKGVPVYIVCPDGTIVQR